MRANALVLAKPGRREPALRGGRLATAAILLAALTLAGPVPGTGAALAQVSGVTPGSTAPAAPPPASRTPAPAAAPSATAAPAAPSTSAPASVPAVAPGFPHVEVALAPLARDKDGKPAAKVTVGDRVEAVLTLQVPASGLRGEPRFPTWRGSWGEAQVIAAAEPVRTAGQDGTATYRQRLVLAAFRPGRVPLPPVAVAVPLAERTLQAATPAELALDVASVLPADAKGKDLEPKPASPPRPLPLGAPFWWTASGLSAACLAAALLLWRRSRARADAAVPALAPLAELLGALAALGAEESDLQLHTRLSLALRRYLGRSLGFPAAESTTSEISRQLAARRLPGPLARRTVELLRACDLVKFARQSAGPARSHERLAAAQEIAGEIEAIVHPPQPAEETSAGPAPLRRAG